MPCDLPVCLVGVSREHTSPYFNFKNSNFWDVQILKFVAKEPALFRLNQWSHAPVHRSRHASHTRADTSSSRTSVVRRCLSQAPTYPRNTRPLGQYKSPMKNPRMFSGGRKTPTGRVVSPLTTELAARAGRAGMAFGGNVSKASREEKRYIRALAKKEEIFSPDDLHVAPALFKLAWSVREAGQPGDAAVV